MSCSQVAFVIFLWILSRSALLSSETVLSGHPESHGVKFIPEGSILNADRFIEAQLLLPFPDRVGKLPEGVKTSLSALRDAWEADSCLELAPTTSNDSYAPILFELLQDELHEAERDLDLLIQKASAVLFDTPGEIRPVDEHTDVSSADGSPTRVRRTAVLLAAGVGLAGAAAIALPKVRCFLGSLLGPCDSDQIEENNAKIADLHASSVSMRTDWLQTKADLNEKFFALGQHLTEVQETQQELIDAQGQLWNETQRLTIELQGRLEGLERCEHYIFRRSEINHLRTGLFTLLGVQLGRAQQYRAVLLDYQTNLLNSLTLLGRGELPLSLVPVDQMQTILSGVLQAVAAEEAISLAIPIKDAHLYYKIDLVRRVAITPEGVVITIAVPFANTPSILDVFRATPLPMLASPDAGATRWDLESHLIAVVRGKQDHALISEHQFRRCRGTPELAICPDAFALYKTPASCVASLYMQQETTVLRKCAILDYELPSPERATDFGDGQWLLESKEPIFSGNILMPGGGTQHSRPLEECRVCLVTLTCGSVLETDTLRIQANAHTCTPNSARVSMVKLATPLETFFRLIPALEDATSIPLSEYRRQMLTSFQKQLQASPRARLDDSSIKLIASPLSETLPALHGVALWDVHFTYWKPALVIGALSFMVSLMLQGLYSCALYRYTLSNVEDIDARFHDLEAKSNKTSFFTPTTPILRPIKRVQLPLQPSLCSGTPPPSAAEVLERLSAKLEASRARTTITEIP